MHVQTLRFEKHTQWKPLKNVGSRPPREPTLHASLPIRPRTNCVYPARDITWAGRITQSVT